MSARPPAILTTPIGVSLALEFLASELARADLERARACLEALHRPSDLEPNTWRPLAIAALEVAIGKVDGRPARFDA